VASDPRIDLGDGAWCALVPDFVTDHEAVMSSLVHELPLRVETVTIAGTAHPTPRLTSWHGDPSATYRYSRRTFVPEPWTTGLATLRQALAATLGADFNGVLANLYRDGDDAMGWHADDEPELGPRAPDDVLIASVSLGACRRFLLAPKRGRAGPRLGFDLGEGSLFVMGGSTQRDFRHRLARTKRAVGPRLNLTFRIVSGA
jgi:alkylated DNA repair dioxygenase AlkB